MNPLISQRRALSIRQPWAELILCGKKAIEIRSWHTAYRGPIWVHAGKFQNHDLDRRFGVHNPFRGGFVGVVNLETIIRFDKERWKKWRKQHLSDGRLLDNSYAWILTNPVRFKEPIPADGALNLFMPSKEFQAQLFQAESIAQTPLK